jgi:hypothetical protein
VAFNTGVRSGKGVHASAFFSRYQILGSSVMYRCYTAEPSLYYKYHA